MADVTTVAVEDFQRAYLAAQLAGDRRQALALVQRIVDDGKLSPGEVRSKVIAAAQREIGELWERNEISVAQEHLATAISQLALAELFQQERSGAPYGQKIIVACVEGELHEFPARLVADELEAGGFAVRFLGADVPTETLVSFLGKEHPDLLVLSATMAFHADNVRQAVKAVREAHPTLPIAVGGQICEWIDSLGSQLAVELAGCDSAALVRDVKRMFDLA
jgi:methanogenic corrinoid protein MtbC1